MTCQYNGRDIDTLEPDIDVRVTEMIDLIRTKYSDTVVDIAAVTRYFTLDVLSTCLLYTSTLPTKRIV